jgi:hypothetical protein
MLFKGLKEDESDADIDQGIGNIKDRKIDEGEADKISYETLIESIEEIAEGAAEYQSGANSFEVKRAIALEEPSYTPESQDYRHGKRDVFHQIALVVSYAKCRPSISDQVKVDQARPKYMQIAAIEMSESPIFARSIKAKSQCH